MNTPFAQPDLYIFTRNTDSFVSGGYIWSSLRYCSQFWSACLRPPARQPQQCRRGLHVEVPLCLVPTGLFPGRRASEVKDSHSGSHFEGNPHSQDCGQNADLVLPRQARIEQLQGCHSQGVFLSLTAWGSPSLESAARPARWRGIRRILIVPP